MKQAFIQWSKLLDIEFLKESDSWESWAYSTLFIVGFLLLMTQISAIQGYTRLNFWISLTCFIPALFAGVCTVLLQDRASTVGIAFLNLCISTGIFFFCAALVAMANGSSKGIFSSLFFFAAAYYGQTLRVTLRHPFLAIGILAALLCGLFFDHSTATITSYAVMAPIGFYLSTITGAWQVRLQEQKADRDRLATAVMAQVQHEQATKLQTLRTALVDIFTSNHDLNNHLQTVILNTQMMLSMAKYEPDRKNDVEMLQDIYNSTERIQNIARSIRSQGEDIRNNQKELQLTKVNPTAENAIRLVGQRYPKVDFTHVFSSEDLMAYVSNGTDTLFRIFENLLLNACQGDGRKGANAIEIRGHRTVSGETVLLEVLDDGPGFPESWLKWEHVHPFQTTKAQGTGVGMYTVEKWVWASGGTFAYGNREEGGAYITIELPCWM